MYTAIVRAARRCVVHRFTSIGGQIRCQLLLRTRWSLPCRAHGTEQADWQGLTRLRVRLCGQSAALCVQGGAWMRVKWTRLSIPAATRVCTRCANFQTTAVSRLQRKSWHCADPRVMDVLLALMHRWRRSGEPYIPVCPSVGRNLSEIVSGRSPTTRLRDN